MAMLDLKSSLSNFVKSTSRSPRIVHPFLWDETHFEALGITHRAVSFETVDAGSHRPPLYGRKLFKDDGNSRLRYNAFTSEVAHVHSELAEGNGSIAAGFLLQYLRAWVRGEGFRSYFVPEGVNSHGARWDLESRDSVYNHTPIQRFACYGWQTYLQADDITILTHDKSALSEQSHSPPVMATATENNMYWYWETYVHRKEKQKESIFRRLRRDVEVRREERRRVLPRRASDLEPIVLAILIGMAQEQRTIYPARGVYTCHFAYPFAHEDSRNPSVSIISITAHFSDSYLETLDFDPRATAPSPPPPTESQSSSPSMSASPAAPRASPPPGNDLIDVRVRVFKDVMTKSSTLDEATERCKFMLQFVGEEVARSIDNLVTRKSGKDRIVPVLRLENEAEQALSRKRRAFEAIEGGGNGAGCKNYQPVQDKMSLKRMCT